MTAVHYKPLMKYEIEEAGDWEGEQELRREEELELELELESIFTQH